MSEELREFLREWLSWAEAGAPKDERFCGGGLCPNAVSWARAKNDKEIVALKELSDLLEAEFPTSYALPFDGTLSNYVNSDCTKNPRRLAWVKEKLRTSQETSDAVQSE